MPWTQPKDLIKQVQRLWDRGVILDSLLSDTPVFPIRLILKSPTSKDLSDNYELVRQWIFSLKTVNHLRLEMKIVNHRVIGENQIPACVWLDHFDDAVKLLQVKKEVKKFSEQISLTQTRVPALIPWIKTHSIRTLQLVEQWPRLLAVVEWMKSNPKPGIYLRQVDIPGIDSKFIESHRGILATLFDLALEKVAINSQASGARHFVERYGFLDKPHRVRFRMLDSSLQLLPGCSQDFTVNHDSFCCLNENEIIRSRLKNLIITENEINFLTFPDMTDSMVLFGAGYGFEFLTDVSWLSQLKVHYWGDIDTHGFAILNQLRAKLPSTKSLLMSEDILLAHEAFWGQEAKPERRELIRLTSEESRLYHKLIDNELGKNLRLEQERIAYSHLVNALKDIQ